MGKPTLNFTRIAGNQITLNEGASIENFFIQVDNSWTIVIVFAGDRSKAKNVTIRYEHNSTLQQYAYYVNADYVEIEDCKLLPWSGGATKGCRGIFFATVTNALVTDCYLEGLENLLYGLLSESRITNVELHGRGTTATYSLGYLTGVQNVVRGVVGEVAAGAGTGLRVTPGVASNSFCLSDVTIYCGSSDDCIGLRALRSSITNVVIRDCRVQFDAEVVCNGGYIFYSVTDANGAIQVEDAGCVLTGLSIDRDGEDAPCIAPGVNADECVVTGCHCDNTGTAESIINDEAGSDAWNLTGNMVDVATAAGNGWQITGQLVI